ncbi:hypothetical protein BVY04_00925, partial [bacterium M21]
MKGIKQDTFGGLVPGTTGHKLPKSGAVVARNVDLTSGSLSPINATPPFDCLHDTETGELISQLPLSDILHVRKPDPVTELEKIRMCVPRKLVEEIWEGSWMFPVFYIWVSYTDGNGDYVEDLRQFGYLAPQKLDYTNDGFIITSSYTQPATKIMDPSIMYKVHGPKLQINFAVDDAYLGGPVSTLDYPE